MTGCGVCEDYLLGTYNPIEGDHTQIANLQHLNTGAIAKVCDTDMLTVEMVMKEIMAQLRH